MSSHVKPEDITTLSLDGTYQPIGFFSARAAIKHLITNRAKAYDRYGNLQDWDGWVTNTAYHNEDNPYMNTTSKSIGVPTIMVINHYFGKIGQSMGMSRRGTSLKHIYKVYKGTCQYCLQNIAIDDATKDHVYPKSKGGANASSNLVLSCKRCNAIKGDIFPYFDKNGNEPKIKSLLPFHHHTLFGPKNVREEWKFFLHL
jgi:5-methylcytosine-specific restriction endonuclease McrA